MQMVEVRLHPSEVVARMSDLRGWLRARGCQHTLTSTGSSVESVVLVEFALDADANDFTREFGGTLVPTDKLQKPQQ